MSAAEKDEHLAAFAAAVRASPHNLLSKRALDELEARHIAECRAFAQRLPAQAKVLDLGTGGGFPGMVIAIVRPDLDVTLLDSTSKKIAFLQDFADSRKIPVSTLDGRAEDLQQAYGAQFDVVTARAVAPLERLLPWALPFLRPGGALYAIKGEKWRDELQTALPLIRRARATVVAVPGADNERPGSPAMPRVIVVRAAG